VSNYSLLCDKTQIQLLNRIMENRKHEASHQIGW